MKLILSRKGFDTSSGGRPSIIDEDDNLISIPIPDYLDEVRYTELHNGDFVKRIEQVYDNAFGDVKPMPDRQFLGQMNLSYCHPDPNITNYFGNEDFLGSLGLNTRPWGLDKNEIVEKDDIFLFFGCFKKLKEDKVHYAIWGYLQVDEVLSINELNDEETAYYWRRTHNPHLNKAKYGNESNTLYVAKENGCGTFKFSRNVELLDENKKGYAIEALKGLGLEDKNRKPSILMRGQDFVIKDLKAVEWAKALIQTATKQSPEQRKSLRAALYVRNSAEDQAKEGLSLDEQTEQLMAYCRVNNWEISGIYREEGHSCQNTDRPEYKRMMGDSDKWDVLLVLKMDRIHCNVENFTQMMDDLSSKGK